MRWRVPPGVRCRLGSEEPETARTGPLIRVSLPAAPSGPDTSRFWSGPLISEAALWGLCSLLLPSLPPGPPPPPSRADVAAVNQSAPAAPRGGGSRVPWLHGPGTPSSEQRARSPSARPGTLPAALGPRRPARGGSPAWFRLEGREERESGPGAPRGSHPRLDNPDGRTGAAARAAPWGAARRAGGAGPTSEPQAAGAARSHTPRSEPAPCPARGFFVSRLGGRSAHAPHRPARRLPTMPASHSHTSARRPRSLLLSGSGPCRDGRALSGTGPAAHQPALVRAQRAAGAGVRRGGHG